jgi:hypothetical protein
MKDILATEPWTFIACHSFDNILLAGDDSHNVTSVPPNPQFLGLGISKEDWINQIEFSSWTSNDFS